MARKWYYHRPNEPIVGPLMASEMRQHAANGNLGSSDQVRRDGDECWYRAARVRGLQFQGSENLATPTDLDDPVVTAELVSTQTPPAASISTHDEKARYSAFTSTEQANRSSPVWFSQYALIGIALVLIGAQRDL